MADRPILFSAPMVRALLAGRKTQTRRVITPQNFKLRGHDFRFHRPDAELLASAFNGARNFRWIEGAFSWVADTGVMHPGAIIVDCRGKPLIAPGDRLWVREAWRTHAHYDDLGPSMMGGEEPIRYEADGAHQTWGYPAISNIGRHRVGMHMPRWASRLTLYVTDVRVERLQDISEEDALAEGVPSDEDYVGSFDREYCHYCGGSGMHGALGAGYGVTEVECAQCETPQLRYRNLWDHINGAGSWAANQWVAAYTFAVRLGNIDTLTATLEDDL